MILKTPSNKDLHCKVKDLPIAKRVINVMKTHFKRHELRTGFVLRQDKEISQEKCAGIQPIVYIWKKTPVFCELTLIEKDDLTICHELVHAHRYMKYGHADARCHDEVSVEEEAVRRCRRIKG